MEELSKEKAKKSLLEDISLLTDGKTCVWAEFNEIEEWYGKGFTLLNYIKQEVYHKMKGKK